MTVTITPKILGGKLPAIASKSQAHRLLICAALSDGQTEIICPTFSEDILATARCLNALGAEIVRKENGFTVTPITVKDNTLRTLDCGESGSTYRFLVPLVCAMGLGARFKLSGRLPSRPMDDLFELLKARGATIGCKENNYTEVYGPISPGTYEIPGNVSSQYISGLLFALPCLGQESEIIITGGVSSAGYIRMTLDALRAFSVEATSESDRLRVPGGGKYKTPGRLAVEGDWSNAAFWLCAAAAGGEGITVTGLNQNSSQGDRAVCDILRRFGAEVEWNADSVTVKASGLRAVSVDVGDIPDLVPALAVATAAAEGESVFFNARRLRFKESDRLKSVCDTLRNLGGDAEYTQDTLKIRGKPLKGGTVDSHGDHRIAMLAAAASVLCKESVTITRAEAVEKSYPDFFEDFALLGGSVRREKEI